MQSPPPDLDVEAITQEYARLNTFLTRQPALAEIRERARAATQPTPRDLLYTEHSVAVYRYRRDTPATHAAPMLVVPSLVNKPSIMDLIEGESYVAAMLARGFEVYILEWGEPNPGQRDFPLERYVMGYLGRAIRRVTRDSGAEKVLLAGYCLGGTFCLLHALRDRGKRVAGLVSMVGPVGFHDAGMLSWWAKRDHFDVGKVVDSFGNVPAEFFSASFPWLVPTASLKKARTVYEKQDDEEFLLSFMALDIWITENVPFPGRAYRELITHGYQENCLVEHGTWPFEGGDVHVADLDVPVLNMAARYDHVAPGSSCLCLDELVEGDITSAERPTGHLGFALGKDIGGKPTPEYWDQIDAWARERGI